MKKENIIVTILIIIIIALGISIFLVFNKYNMNNRKNNEPNNTEKDQENNDENIPGDNPIEDNVKLKSGTYHLTFKDTAPDDFKANTPSTIVINDDSTFTYKYNKCEYMEDIKGTYSIDDNNNMKFTNLEITGPYEISSLNVDTINFTLLSNGEFYINSDVFLGCETTGNQYASFIKS